ncbi:ROK family transcriptional regulator [Conexibacter sp. SYSU D00693]|uniref:ROK family transcriptional regulator n=1 Tax=Conexibacter sp. SYSU D00693 TaxID=2812560 RepID=UPI00196A7429|nr:ROK family transcriptional regulator [Conexibacter sp. SYSU D00693]
MDPEHRVGSLQGLRVRNRALVVSVLRRRGTASRAEIARATGLSRSTVSTLVGELQDDGLVVEHEAAAPRGGTGRPPVLLALDPSAGVALGLDFGHRHLRVAVADLSSRVLAERRVELDVDHSATASLDAAAELADDVLEEAGIGRDRVVGAGMGLPGPVHRGTGLVGSSVILPGWAGLHAQDELSERLGMPVEVDNDANLGALAELRHGAARGEADVVYVKVASGIGAGIVLGGRLHQGVSGVAGELGHVEVVPEGGEVCRCGKRGCLETVAAGASLLGLLRSTHGDDLDLPGLVRLAREGDLSTNRVVGDAGRAIGRVLADLCNHLNPSLVVIGGELAAAGDALVDGVREAIGRHALAAAADVVRVEPATLGERAELLGALALVITGSDHLAASTSAGAGRTVPRLHP